MGDMRSEREAMMKLPAPERMEKMLDRTKEHQKKMKISWPLDAHLYGQLNAEQKNV